MTFIKRHLMKTMRNPGAVSVHVWVPMSGGRIRYGCGISRPAVAVARDHTHLFSCEVLCRQCMSALNIPDEFTHRPAFARVHELVHSERR